MEMGEAASASPARYDLLPKVIDMVAWKRKEKFLLYEDTYREWVMFAVEDGSFHYEIKGRQGTAAFGDLVICPPETPFRRVIVTPLTFYFIRFFWEDAAGTAVDPGEAIPVGKVSIQDTARLSANYAWLVELPDRRSPVKLGLINHVLRDLWLMYCREKEGAGLRGDRTTVDPLMAEALEQLQRRAFQPLNLRDIAASLGMTSVQFSKRFKKAYGETPIDYLTRLRMEKARTLLIETKLSLEQISECCGYANGFYLHRVFVKQMGVTPSQYRKGHRV